MASKRVLSIEVGVQTTRICEMDFKSKKPSVYGCCVFETPDGAVEDGFIRNREILSVAMKEAIGKAGMKSTSVVFSIASSKIANREVNMPIVNDNKIKGLIDSNAKEYFPVNIDEYVVTYKVLEKVTEGDDKNLRVLVLAAPSTLIETYYDFVKMMGFDILAIDYVGNSCFQVIKKQTGDGVNVIVQLNEQNTLINILDGEVLSLQRTVPYGMNAMVEAALNCGEFDIEDRKSAIDKLQAEQLINSKLNESVIDDVALSYMENNDDSYATQLRQMKAKDEITETFNYLISNIIRVLDYYTAKNPDKKIDALHLSGVGSRINGISSLFRNEIFVDIFKFDNILGIEFERTCQIADDVKSDYVTAVGAAIDPVDFIPKAHLVMLRKKSESKGAALIFTGCLVISVLVVGASFAMNLMAKNEKKNLQTDIDGMSDVAKTVDEYNKIKIKKENIDNAYAGSLNFNFLLGMFIDEMETSLPKGVTVNSISTTAEGVNLNFTGSSMKQVGESLVQLKKCTLIDSVNVNSISSAQNESGVYTYAFTIQATLPTIDYKQFIDNEVTESLLRSMILGEDEEKSAGDSKSTDASKEPEATTNPAE